MISKTLYIKSALVLSAFFLTNFAWSQRDILELLPGSDRLEFDESTGTHKLYGNVNFKYQGNIMYCDSAYYFQNRDEVYAYGKVHINKDNSLNLFCDSLYYNGKKDLAKLWGNVRVRDEEYKLTTDTLEYNAKLGQGIYRHGGRVESIVNNEILTSKVGYFYPETKNFYFSNNVDYQSKEIKMSTDTLRYLYSEKTTYFAGPTEITTSDALMHCEKGWYNTSTEEGSLQKNANISREKEYIAGDTLIYKPKEGLSIGYGNVKYVDSIQKITFRSNYAFSSDSLNYSLLTGRALAEKHLEKDTLYIHADTLYSYKRDSVTNFKALHNAKIFSTNLCSKSDSIIYEKDSNKLVLYNDPIVWGKDSELKGDIIWVYIEDTIVHTVDIYNNASILMEVEPDEYYNQIAGQKVTAFLKDNDIYKATATGNAVTIAFPESEEKNDSIVSVERMGMNRLYSSELRIDIDSNEITGISYTHQPDGKFYPIDQINPEEQFISNFKWNYGLKPKSIEDLFKRD